MLLTSGLCPGECGRPRSRQKSRRKDNETWEATMTPHSDPWFAKLTLSEGRFKSHQFNLAAKERLYFSCDGAVRIVDQVKKRRE